MEEINWNERNLARRSWGASHGFREDEEEEENDFDRREKESESVTD